MTSAEKRALFAIRAGHDPRVIAARLGMDALPSRLRRAILAKYGNADAALRHLGLDPALAQPPIFALADERLASDAQPKGNPMAYTQYRGHGRDERDDLEVCLRAIEGMKKKMSETGMDREFAEAVTDLMSSEEPWYGEGEDRRHGRGRGARDNFGPNNLLRNRDEDPVDMLQEIDREEAEDRRRRARDARSTIRKQAHDAAIAKGLPSVDDLLGGGHIRTGGVAVTPHVAIG
jgi:hypothetical protein